MKVILLQDIARVGRKHEIKQVPDGHAQNYLIPRKLALLATPQNLKWQSEQKAHMASKVAETAELFTAFLARTAEASIMISAAANKQGHLFKGLRGSDIARTLTDEAYMTIPASAIALERPIKEVGEHPLIVTMGGVRGKVVITVKAS